MARWAENLVGAIIWILIIVVIVLLHIDYEHEAVYASGMPCENHEAFERWEEWRESQTSKEEVQKEIWSESESADKVESESHKSDMGNIKVDTVDNYTIYEGASETDTSDCENDGEFTERYNGGMTYESEAVEETNAVQASEREEVLETVHEGEPATQGWTPISTEAEPQTMAVYEVGQEIHGLLAEKLSKMGIDWWTPYAIAQMMQESGGNPYAENPNGLDKGLFQYRITYWTEPESIFDVNAQIRVYCNQVYARICAGLSIEEIISRHYTSDYVTEIDWNYVNAVLARVSY